MAVEGKNITAKVSVPLEWLTGLEAGLGVELSELSEQELTKMFSFALGYVDYSNEGIIAELKGFISEARK